MALSIVLTGCGNSEEPVADEPTDTQEVVSIGVALSSPGLASGSNPDTAAGAEVALAEAIAGELDTIAPDAQLQWVPIGASDPVSAIQDGDMEFMLGQLSDEQMDDQLGWVGPYVTAHPTLLVRQAPETLEDPAAEALSLPTITTAKDLVAASLCVVENSGAAALELPIEHVTVQQTVTECEVGMQSGRYDAIAADDLQLAGIVLDPNLSSRYELVAWSEIADEEDLEIPKELLEPRDYWIGVAATQCDAMETALRTAISQGALVDAFSEWEETTDVEPELGRASDITTRHCGS